VKSVTKMRGMFNGASSFNQPLPTPNPTAHDDGMGNRDKSKHDHDHEHDDASRNHILIVVALVGAMLACICYLKFRCKDARADPAGAQSSAEATSLIVAPNSDQIIDLAEYAPVALQP